MFRYYARSTKLFTGSSLNISDIIKDNHVINQTEQLLRFLPKLNKPNNFKALVFDYFYYHMPNNFLTESFHMKNIDIVEINPLTALYQSITNVNAFELYACEYFEKTDKKYDIIYLNINKGILSMLYLFHQILKNHIVTDKCIIHLNFSATKEDTNINDYWCNDIKLSPYKITKLYDGVYNTHDDKRTIYCALLIEKK